MRQMTCELRPDLYAPVLNEDAVHPNFPLITSETPADREFADEVNATWRGIQNDLVGAVGPILNKELLPNKDFKRLRVREAAKEIAQLPTLTSKIITAGLFVVAKTNEAFFYSQKELESNHRERLRFVFGNYTDAAYRVLLDSLTQEASNNGGQTSATAEEWTDLCIENLDQEYFRKVTGNTDPAVTDLVIGASALALIDMPRFNEPVKMIGQRKFGTILQAIDSPS